MAMDDGSQTSVVRATLAQIDEITCPNNKKTHLPSFE